MPACNTSFKVITSGVPFSDETSTTYSAYLPLSSFLSVLSVVFDFLCNKDNASKIIEYFKSIGIEKIDELLINKIEIFLVDYDSSIKSFNNYDISTLVQLINEDINAINIVRN